MWKSLSNDDGQTSLNYTGKDPQRALDALFLELSRIEGVLYVYIIGMAIFGKFKKPLNRGIVQSQLQMSSHQVATSVDGLVLCSLLLRPASYFDKLQRSNTTLSIIWTFDQRSEGRKNNSTRLLS